MPKKAKKKSAKKKPVKLAKKTVAKKKRGRPKRVFTAAQIKQMEEYAYQGCRNCTIARLMDLPVQTVADNLDGVLTKQRCRRKLELRKQQNRAAEDGNAAMLIFMGKNELGQTDKIEEKMLVSGEVKTQMVIVRPKRAK